MLEGCENSVRPVSADLTGIKFVLRLCLHGVMLVRCENSVRPVLVDL